MRKEKKPSHERQFDGMWLEPISKFISTASFIFRLQLVKKYLRYLQITRAFFDGALLEIRN
ncbi:MAG: hypothetical protein A3I44_05650 [Candidatus Sungbacteria bacterium RIFCSPLOWO2_02_FULL_51_17]|uniref:Uncharacterized protein n=1 Tax=Candidatus Sungbacteria bacterium RIFCSPHIGHO2_02_FULL_51_29 TaxID=1802273 RepID=A0A1G2KR59_9BACT|nr:MAG: hypothetical protein A3C16_02950 [Candidatus Sungbacteria bacterium RIFCSPHIGHO2_02_FULL_51_29]OHA11734.1 MAG: hypothetical protein A3I44_05650 [Candidatus Sungbacteria bacterium RIFCSPLOWO2_02_FULL_51_17]